MSGGEIVKPLDKPSTNSLIPLLGVRWAWGVTELATVGLLSLCWLWFSYIPLAPGELWSQLARVDHFPLLENVPGAGQQFATASALKWVTAQFGLEGIAALVALVGMVSSLFLWRTMFRIHQRPLLAAVSVVVLTASISIVSADFQSAIFGFLSFALLLFVVSGQSETQSVTRSAAMILLVGAAMVLWVNSSSSFVIGLLVLASATRGTGYAALKSTGSLTSIWSDARFRQSVYRLEAGFVGMLINPLGIDALLHADFVEWFVTDYADRTWQPLILASPAGVLVGVLLIVTLWLFRSSRASLDPALLVAWIGTLALTWIDQSALLWSLPLTLLVLQPLFAERLEQRWPRVEKPQKSQDELTAADFRLTLVSLLVIWIAFTFSPLGSRVLGGKGRNASQVIASSLPLNLTSHWNQSPPVGQIVHPPLWGDWLAFAGTDKLQLYVGVADLDVCPQSIYNDQINLLTTGDDWEKRADRYRVNTILLDADVHATSIAKLEDNANWRKTYEDAQAVVFQRAGGASSANATSQGGAH